MQSFGSTITVPQTAFAVNNLAMNGAHHRVLMEQDFADDENMVWVTGDMADDDDKDTTITAGEVGIAHDFGSSIRAGFGVGRGSVNQDLSFNGEQEVDGQYIMGEINYLIPETRVIVSLTGIYGGYDADITRGYLNAGTPDASEGATDIEILSIRLQADWVNLLSLPASATRIPRSTLMATPRPEGASPRCLTTCRTLRMRYASALPGKPI